jgi:hypothetical protein
MDEKTLSPSEIALNVEEIEKGPKPYPFPEGTGI